MQTSGGGIDGSGATPVTTDRGPARVSCNGAASANYILMICPGFRLPCRSTENASPARALMLAVEVGSFVASAAALSRACDAWRSWR